MNNFKWEIISKYQYLSGADIRETGKTSRAKVPGGWVLKHVEEGVNEASVSMVYIPDNNHRWDVDPSEWDNKNIKELGLTVRTTNCLLADHINTVGELLSKSEIDILKIPHLGKRSFNEIINLLAEKNLHFKRINNVED